MGVRGTAWSPETRLYADGVVLGARGEPVTVPPHSAAERVPGTGLAGPEDAPPGAAAAAPDAVAEERAALARACLPGIGTRWEGMARTALVDIRTLMFRGGAADGAMVAASSPHWRYVWPRDASYCAVALHLCGLGDEAARVLDYLARVLPRDRPWDARYLPDGSGRVPDARGVQLDGAGWVLWAVWHWAGGAARRATVEGGGGRRAKRAVAVAGEPAWRRIEPLARAALAIVLDALADGAEPGLPRPSSDYWEKRTPAVTLGAAAPLLLGARCAADLFRGRDGAAADSAAAAAAALDRGIERRFAPLGHPRDPETPGLDASVAFLLPPFAPERSGPHASWLRAVAALRTGNGGVRPGENWPDPVTAWTPQVSLFALTAACSGERALAEELLDWLEARRTRLGSLPEKVTSDGRPAAVAPLALTGATVLAALAALEGRALPTPPARLPPPSAEAPRAAGPPSPAEGGPRWPP
ncbi:hypothetical protein [Nocardiopsis composta]|uniref:GH15-like domain-containing protein n=1 Tax=Nocardiopsis composta TaxID=157465 RepID=A0A7W8QKE4_9ACTN|nr:hypothetical protein [Nocardiopsis composta]MBB5432073.1 hypothetical protein [Nocardiopsis composta]